MRLWSPWRLVAFAYAFAALLTVAASAEEASDGYCPGSPSTIHAKCSLTAMFDNPCDVVKYEVLARVQGTPIPWQDPHNHGTYAMAHSSEHVLEGTHVTGSGTYTDKFKLTFEEGNPGECVLHACSESQVFSIYDFDTNYCNLRNLYCSARDGCVSVHSDLTLKKEELGSCLAHNKRTCTSAPAANGLLDVLPPRKFLQRLFSDRGTRAQRPLELTSSEAVIPAVSDSKEACPIVETQPNFDLSAYVAARWYVQQQMATEYLPSSWNFCTQAVYKPLERKSFNGYTIQVHNYAEEEDGTVHKTGNFLCAMEDPEANDSAKLLVGPCFLPNIPGRTTGPYWVLAYDEGEGFALISGGQPTVRTPDGCTTSAGTNGAGLWIFTRQQTRDDKLVNKVRGIAKAKGFDVSVLEDVAQEGCPSEAPL
uniref:Lipocalin/cytosolic fatty-acid binding domain-containing protein n=1 Tax=Pyramimonas obovata TaxID=1411642 RepID=A0A7S0RNB3_9CHLO|mmetsp:Transcript_38666/g.84098  ORF Transcript_38666/g.84098 Transcript_38666/m.84098 type:complete len:422 (+) Transcript_38666:181-1446(+)|eukprot:CAMPEP_0118940574 /NCGR_PEP_ID=MMETSP1169-20130426/31801_1 /TAXON_ID=36882 /ORGANISM="Pyramimonas obovata, Strain CCMP722" /LENGTH=421 /DNA_ID=CAMNT_0006885107 /DNA_START=66 /DNA_END=1331 /DNA_ORIENTATION=-